MTDQPSEQDETALSPTEAPPAELQPTDLQPIELPYSYDVENTALGLAEAYPELEPGTETGVVTSIAGRLMLRRVQGKLAFGTLQDHTGRIQLFAPSKTTPDFDAFGSLSLGDWIGVRGEIMTTKRGELSVRVDSWELLAPTQRPFPDKFHGISDQDMRFRQRYVDLWVTPESRETFANRSKIISLLRRWMEDEGYMEVETPVFHPVPGGALARPFETHHNALDMDLYLRIAPELYLKRLVVGGFPRVFEIARVFRNEGLSTRHNPEFTMFECYEAYADYTRHMELTEQLVSHLAMSLSGTTKVTFGDREIDLAGPWRRAPLCDLLSEAVGETTNLDTPIERLQELCDEHEVPRKDSYGPGKLILELYEKLVEANLWEPTFVTDYPAEVSPLSRRHRDDDRYVERFEGIVAGRELCNGFSELCDPSDQRERFEAQASDRDGGDLEAMAVDEDYLRALEYGLPPTVGLGIGIDRLVMLLTGSTTIRDVVLFPTLRPEQDRTAAE